MGNRTASFLLGLTLATAALCSATMPAPAVAAGPQTALPRGNFGNRAVTIANLAFQPETASNVHCSPESDRFQYGLEQRKLAFRLWAHNVNTAIYGQHPGNGTPTDQGWGTDASSVLSYFSISQPSWSAPWTEDKWRPVLMGQLQPIYDLQSDQDMGINGWIRVLYLYGNNPALSPTTQATIAAALKNYKYWIDEPVSAGRVDPHVQNFHTENHQAMYATAEFLLGQMFPNDRFIDGNPGSYHMQRAAARLQRWLNDRLTTGFAEWNAPVYYEYDILSMLNLVDFSADPQIAARAAMVLDLLFFDLARFTQRGSFGVTSGRGYFEHKASGWTEAVGDTIQLLFGTRGVDQNGDTWGWSNAASTSALATTTRYCVPSAILAIGQDHPEQMVDRTRVSVDLGEIPGVGYSSDTDGLFWWSKQAYYVQPMVRETQQLIAKWNYQQPLHSGYEWITAIPGATNDLSTFFEGTALTRANLYTYRDSGAMLSSVQGFRPGQMSPQLNAWQATFDAGVTVFGTYPRAADVKDNHDGPNWWTGNVINPYVLQMGSAAIAVYAPDPLGAQAQAFGHRTHLWFPFAAHPNLYYVDLPCCVPQAGPWHFDHWTIETQHWSNDLSGSVWIFGKKLLSGGGEGYIGIYSAQPCQASTTGAWAGKEIICDGLRNAFVIQVGSQKTFGSYEHFVDLCRHAHIYIGAGFHTPANPFADVLVNFDTPDPNMAAIPGGHRLQVDYNRREARFGNQVIDVTQFPRFQDPYTNTPWGATHYTISYNNLSLTHDLPSSSRTGNNVAPSQLIGQFKNVYWSRNTLYGVQPDGELLWYANLLGDDEDPADAKKRLDPRGQPVSALQQDIAGTAQSGAVQSSRLALNPRAQGNAIQATVPPSIQKNWIVQWQGPKPVGVGWTAFKDIIPGEAGSFYGLTPQGGLKWYRHDGINDGTPRWTGPFDVGTGWTAFSKVVGMGEGVLYGIGNDGSLRWYRQSDEINRTNTSYTGGWKPRWFGPTVVGSGWQAFKQVFGGGQGVIYAITPDGRLLWYRHLGYLTGTMQWQGPEQIGTGWQRFVHVFSGGAGHIYAIDGSGTLYWYLHDGYQDGTSRWQRPLTVAQGWGGFVNVFPAMLAPAPVLH
jgi:hypothetical protein